MAKKDINRFFKRFNLTDAEIRGILEMCPLLDSFSEEKYKTNITCLGEFGYPIIDIEYLLLSNPSFLLYEKDELITRLETLTQEYSDLEELLKDDPTLL